MLSDLENVVIQDYPISFWKYFARAHEDVLIKNGFKSINLGNFPKGFLEERNIRFDEGFYLQAGVDFQNRWDSFFIPEKKPETENAIAFLRFQPKEYIFLHEDRARGMIIDREKLPKGIPIISSEQLKSTLSFFEFIPIIRNASRIDCIESSFCALIEGLGDIYVPKYAHRYARSEARNNWVFEFTYKSTWIVYN
jgi:hypothetical protein